MTTESHSRERPVRNYQTLSLEYSLNRNFNFSSFRGIAEDIYYWETYITYPPCRYYSFHYDSKVNQLSNDSLIVGDTTFYHVIEYHQPDPPNDYYLYYSKNVGAIQEIQIYPDSTVKTILVKYDVIQ